MDPPGKSENGGIDVFSLGGDMIVVEGGELPFPFGSFIGGSLGCSFSFSDVVIVGKPFGGGTFAGAVGSVSGDMEGVGGILGGPLLRFLRRNRFMC